MPLKIYVIAFSKYYSISCSFRKKNLSFATEYCLISHKSFEKSPRQIYLKFRYIFMKYMFICIVLNNLKFSPYNFFTKKVCLTIPLFS